MPRRLQCLLVLLIIYHIAHKATVKILTENNSAWRTDEEFAREMLAGLNPVIIRRLEVNLNFQLISQDFMVLLLQELTSIYHMQEFPPASKLDTDKYGNHTSTITKGHIDKNMNGLSVDQVLSLLYLFPH